MEINFLVFPAPRCTFTEKDLKGCLIRIPFIPSLFQPAPQTRVTTNTIMNRSASQQSMLQSQSSVKKPLTRASFQKQKPLNPPEQQPNDVSCTVYDDLIDEEMPRLAKLSSPQNVDVYVSGNFTSKNCFSSLPKQLRLSQVTLSRQASRQRIIATKRDDLSDHSMIQAEEIVCDKPSSRINEFNFKASKATSSQKQLDLYGSLVNKHTLVKQNIRTPMLAQSQSNLLSKMESTKKHSQKDIPCLYLKSPVPSKFLMLYFHGNGEDIYQSMQLLDFIKMDLKVNILAMEYPGYGLYPGKPSEEAILADASYIYQYLTKHSGIEEKNIIIFGRSIGTGPATHLAAEFNPGLLVLMSPFLTLREVIRHSYGSIANLVQERFNNRESIRRVQCPTFLLHGLRDNIIPVVHSKELLKLCGGVCELRTPPQMDHVRFVFQDDLTTPLREFMRANNLIDTYTPMKRYIH